MQTLRLASAAVASRYPLPISGHADWRRDAVGWTATIGLPDLPNDHIVVPSFAAPAEGGLEFSAALQSGDATWRLTPTARCMVDPGTVDPRASTHIDYFHSHADLARPTLAITVARREPPADYLLTVSVRACEMTPDAGVATTPRLVVPAVSQLTAPTPLRHRICSPTCVTMVLAYHRTAASLADVTAACLHHPSKLYGVWPLAIRAAADAGIVGAVECFTSLDDVAGVLRAGLPVVASIRFDADALPGAPLRSTGGHLVVVTGLDLDHVHVNDPAARDASVVPRSYPRTAFAAAWLTSRGAGYVFTPL